VTENSLFAIHPYKHLGLWVFDDETVGLVQEQFVAGADEIIEKMVEGNPDAEKGFTLLFSVAPFPGCNATFEWQRDEDGGNWYYLKELDMKGWLCPALFKYVEKAPGKLYAQFRRRSA
jgi:hypothetical protein